MTTTHTPKRRPETLAHRLEHAQALHRIWQDLQAEPLPRLRSWCGSSLELDYEQYGVTDMNRRIVAWMGKHSRCGADSCVAEKEGSAS